MGRAAKVQLDLFIRVIKVKVFKLKMTEENCIFCNYKLIRNDILFNSNNFFVKVGVGILASGHIMLITKNHINCFANLSNDLKEEFLLLKEDIFKQQNSTYLLVRGLSMTNT